MRNVKKSCQLLLVLEMPDAQAHVICYPIIIPYAPKNRTTVQLLFDPTPAQISVLK